MTTALIDVAHYFRAAWHVSGHEHISTAVSQTEDMVYRISSSPDFDNIICCFDAPPYKRAEIYPAYKANRGERDADMVKEQRRLYKVLAERFHVAASPGYEADDVIAGLCEFLGGDVVIFTNDKDLAQLVNDEKRIRIVNSKTGATLDEGGVREKFGVPPAHIPDLLALMGDKSDNVPGVPGVGPKTAADLITTHGYVSGVLDAARAGHIGGAVGKKIADAAGDVLVSLALVRLTGKEAIEGLKNPEALKKRKEVVVEAADIEDRLIEDAIADDRPKQEAAVEVVDCAPQAAPAKSASIERRPEQAAIVSVELRPGLSITSAQLSLYRGMAERFHAGQLYGRSFKTVEALFTVMLLGVELGLPPQAALSNVHIIEGKPCLSSHLIISKGKSHPDCVYLECVDEQYGHDDPSKNFVTYATKKTSYGKEQRFTYSQKDAMDDQMRWAKGGKNFRAMLRKTAGCQAVRLWYPETTSGMYGLAEMGEEEDDTVA